MSRALTVLALLAAGGLVVAVGAQQPRRGLRSEAVVVYYEPRDEAFARIAFDTARQALPQLQTALGLADEDRDPRPIRLEVVRTEADFTRLVGYQMPPWVQGVSLSGRRLIVVKTLLPAVMRTVVAHELIHALLDEVAGYGGPEHPRWLHEGLAKFVTEDYTEADRQALHEAVKNKHLLTLDQLDPAFGGDRQTVSLAYAQSVSLVRFLHELQPGGRLATLLANYRLTGGDLPRTLLRTYGLPVDQLQARWLAQIADDYRFRRDPFAAEALIFAGMALVFALAWRVRSRRAQEIRARMQEEERLRRIMGESGLGETDEWTEPPDEESRLWE